jgi:hypothetical protein
MKCRVLAGCVALVAAAAGLVRGEPEAPPRPLVLSPAAAPSPALRFPLLPPLRERQPGNALPLYRKAGETLLARRPLLNDPGSQRHSRWLEMPLARLRDEVTQAKEYLKVLDEMFEQVEVAARRETCDWGVLEECLKDEPKLIPLFDSPQKMREFTFYLQLRARVAVADDRPEDALRDVQTVFAIARHLAQSPIEIHSLVAHALLAVATGMLEPVIQHPKAPNLYWSLTDLPRPFVDLRPVLQGEGLLFYASFPGLTRVAVDRNAGAVPPEKMERYGKQIRDMGFIDPRLTKGDKGDLTALISQIPGAQKVLFGSSETMDFLRFGQEVQLRHEAAKRALIADGRPREKVEEMPPLQVALLHAGLDQERLLDEVQKWDGFPYWQAKPGLEELWVKLKPSGTLLPEAPALRLASMEVSGLTRIYYTRARAERRIAVLRCVEAVRLYAAAHDGKLPASLAEIREVPIPIDPMTGKAFEYRVEGDLARLSAVFVAPDSPAAVPSYELTVRR